ncbi:MAG: fibronectin type III domain-containing protein [Treponema sp.]|nr:fibronectin type III domain-containing protein [Treponema sp.]
MPGTDLPDIFRGRYVQLAADFYPSGDGEISPYLEEIRLVYRPDEPPLPPTQLRALARDGEVQLDWKPGPDGDIQGYLVYYGTVKGEYFGNDAMQGPSPIDAGARTGLRIGGLKNGVLYHFAVAAYDRKGAGDAGPYHAGEFSREVSARPLRMAE